MIHVEITYSGSEISKLVITGHGGLEYGKDIVCAGCSTCLIGALNTLDHAESFKIDIKSGFADVDVISEVTEHDKVVLETLVVQLETLAKSYGDNIKISKERG